jgi:hypothetical protein
VQVGAQGFGHTTNTSIATLEVFEGRLYAGTGNPGGGHVWRSGDGSTWQQLSVPWSPSNTQVNAGQVFGGHLYLGTGAGANEPAAEIWRTDGVSWTQVVSSGFGNGQNRGIAAMAVFSDALYAVMNCPATGLEVWRSASGGAGDWSQANEDGFGGAGTAIDAPMSVYSHALYVGTGRDGLAELWRSDDGATWTAVFTDGLDNPDNERVLAMAPFSGQLYIGLVNETTGAEVWRSDDGTAWTRAAAGGLGNADNRYPYAFVVLDDMLYLVFAYSPTGAEVWRTADGLAWERVNENGWGDSRNAGGFGTAVFGGRLYVGSLNWRAGAEVWRYGHKLYLPLVLREAGG